MKLALAQIRVAGGDLAGNVARAVDAVDRAASRGADLVALPEVFDASMRRLRTRQPRNWTSVAVLASTTAF